MVAYHLQQHDTMSLIKLLNQMYKDNAYNTTDKRKKTGFKQLQDNAESIIQAARTVDGPLQQVEYFIERMYQQCVLFCFVLFFTTNHLICSSLN